MTSLQHPYLHCNPAHDAAVKYVALLIDYALKMEVHFSLSLLIFTLATQQ